MVAASFIAGVNRTTHWGSQLYFPITRYVLKEEGRTADCLVYSAITLVVKNQAVWTTSYHTQFRIADGMLHCKPVRPYSSTSILILAIKK